MVSDNTNACWLHSDFYICLICFFNLIQNSFADFTPNVSGIPPDLREKKRNIGLIVGVTVSAGIVGLVLLFLFLYLNRKREKDDEDGKFLVFM